MSTRIARRRGAARVFQAAITLAKSGSAVSNSVSTEPADPCFPDVFCEFAQIANPPSSVRLRPAPLAQDIKVQCLAFFHARRFCRQNGPSYLKCYLSAKSYREGTRTANRRFPVRRR